MKRTRILFLVRRVGPYHDARYDAAGLSLDLTVVETRPGSAEYPWATAAGARHYRLEAFKPAESPEVGLRGPALEAEVARCLAEFRPEAVACAGWADPEYHVMLRRCQAGGVPAVVMSDSTFGDEPRRWWKELAKGWLVRNYASAVVAGSRSRDYLRALGFPARAIFQPWDVVDNRYFADGADVVRGVKSGTGAVAEPLPRSFLCVARFIPKKNLERLIAAYAAYVAECGADAWNLVFSGSGPLETRLRAEVGAAGLGERVSFAGFLQYPDLPDCYARAGALVLPSWSDQWGLVVNEAMAAGLPVLVSSRCGCSPDLVREGENGFVFDPGDPAALTAGLVKLTRLDRVQLHAMGRRSREIVAGYSPAAFAAGLADAVAFALSRRDRPAPRLSRVLVSLLAGRREDSA